MSAVRGRKAARPRVERVIEEVHQGPSTVKTAIRIIVGATIVATVLGGVLGWLFDRRDFGTLGNAMWWSLQTVTTVGYGDVTPKHAVGRLIGAGVILYSAAFLAILTAAITTSFIERSRGERKAAERPDTRVLERLDEIAVRLDRLEQRLAADDER